MDKQLELKAKRSGLSLKEKRPIMAFIETVCILKDGLAVYADMQGGGGRTWSDEEVAKKFGCTKHNIAGIRKDIVGDLVKKKEPKEASAAIKAGAELLNDIVLAKRIALLEKWLTIVIAKTGPYEGEKEFLDNTINTRTDR